LAEALLAGYFDEARQSKGFCGQSSPLAVAH
jgi:hypothetical protein